MQVNFARFWNTPFVQLFCLSFLSIKMLVFRNFPILFDPTPAKNVFFFKIRIIYRNIFLCTSKVLFFLNATGIFRCSWERASNKILDLSWKPVGFFFKNQLRFTGLLIPFYLDFVKLSNYLTRRKTQQPSVLLYTNEIFK